MRFKNKFFKLRLGKKLSIVTVLSIPFLFFLINTKSTLFAQWKITSNFPLFDKRKENKSSAKVEESFSSNPKQNVITRRYPYVQDPLCQNFSLSLYEDDTFPLTGLVSFPGSGNTWARHLIQLATGAYTGSFYFDVELFAGGFLGEREIWHSGRTIVQKFHEKFSERMYLDKAILLIREPFPAILAFANYLEAGHTGNSFRLPFHHKDWPNFLLHSAYNWLSLAKSWIESPVSLLVIHYENLRLQPEENVRNICNFLNHSCQNLLRPCFQRQLKGNFKRSQVKSLKDTTRFNRYPTSVQTVISRGIDHLNSLLGQSNLETIPLHLYKYYRSDNPHNSFINTTNHSI